MWKLGLEGGPSGCVDLPTETAAHAVLLEISWIHEVSDVIQEKAPKINLK